MRGILGAPPGFGQAAATRKAMGQVARDVMTSPVVTVEERTSLHEAAGLMVRSRINRLPVLRDGRVVGIISRADVVRALVRPDDEITRVVREALLHELWRRLWRKTLSSLPESIDISPIGIDVR